MLLVFTLILLLMLPLLLIAIHKKGGDSAALFGTNPILWAIGAYHIICCTTEKEQQGDITLGSARWF